MINTRSLKRIASDFLLRRAHPFGSSTYPTNWARAELGLELITKFGGLFNMRDLFYRIRPIMNGTEFTPGMFWDKLVRGKTPKIGDKIMMEQYGFSSGPVDYRCCVNDVQRSRFGLDEVYVNWMPPGANCLADLLE